MTIRRTVEKNKITFNLHFLCLLCIILLPANLARGQSNIIDLEESKRAALKYNNAIANGQLKLEEAELAKKEAYAAYFPSVSALGVVAHNFNDFINPIPFILTEGIDNIYNVGATANEVLYAGGKVTNSNRLAEVQVEVSRIRKAQTVDSVLLLTEQKYWGLVQLQEQRQVLQSSKEYLDELLSQQQDLLDAGLIARNDLLKVQVERSRVLLEENKLKNKHKTALLDFSYYIGIPYDTSLVARVDFGNATAPLLKYGGPDLRLQENRDYQLLEKAVTAKKLQTKLAQADLLPNISIGFSATRLGTFHEDLDSDFMPIGFGTVNIPISDWWGAGRQRLNQSQIRQEIAINNLEEGSDRLKVAIMKSWYDFSDAYKQISFALENLELATENLEVARDNYESGLSNLSDLLDAQRMYQEAETELVTAYANYEEKESVYLYRTDQLKITNPE